MSRPHNDVATSSPLSPISTTWRLHSSMSRRPLKPPMSRRRHDVATSTPSCCYSARSRRPFPCRDLLLCYPRRDLIMMSRHQFQLAIQCRDLNPMSRCQPLLIQVATPTRRRDTNPSSFCKNFILFFSPVASLLLLGPSSPYKTCYPLDDAVA